MLRALGGRTHTVVSGLVLLFCRLWSAAAQRPRPHSRSASVRLDERLCCVWYLEREGVARAPGPLKIQGAGAALVLAKATANYENVVGLPLCGAAGHLPRAARTLISLQNPSHAWQRSANVR